MSARISFSGKLADPMVTDVVVAAVVGVVADTAVVVGAEVLEELPHAVTPTSATSERLTSRRRRIWGIPLIEGQGMGKGRVKRYGFVGGHRGKPRGVVPGGATSRWRWRRGPRRPLRHRVRRSCGWLGRR